MRPRRTRWPTLALLGLTLAASAASARGQDRDKEKDKDKEPAALFPEGYLGHEALGAALKALAAAHPDRVRVEALGRSGQGREVWLATVGRPDPKSKPAVLVVANLEGDHVVGSQVALGMLERLADAAKPAGWLDRVTLYVVPRLNPDGAERALSATPRAFSRANLRPLDRDRDGREGEDGPDDLNGDGVVTRMRVKDPSRATLVPEEGDPRRLRAADTSKGEKGVYAEEDEGRDDDGDGLRNEDPPGGVNLNRNWPHRWSEWDPEAGSSPASEPEVFALISFAFAHPEVAAVWSFGLNDNLRDKAEGLADADAPVFAELSRAFARAAPVGPAPRGGSAAGKGSPAPGATSDGAASGWAYHQFGALGLASRLYTTPEIPGPAEAGDPDKDKDKDKPRPAVPDDGEARWLYWNDHVVGGRAFVPFAAVAHPTLGRVEVGGWRPGVRFNPPAAQAGAIAESHLAFLAELAARLPRLAVPEVKVEAKGGGLFAVTAVVANEGPFPTALAEGVKTRSSPPVLVRLDAGKARLLTGRALQRVDALAGASAGPGARREFTWLVSAPEGVDSVRLTVSCPRAGRVEKVVGLK